MTDHTATNAVAAARIIIRPADQMPAPGVAALPPDMIFVAETDDVSEHAARVRLGERLLANLTNP